MKGVLTVIGKDRVGIIYGISKILAEKNVNIEDISQTILQDYFTMMMLVDLTDMNCDFSELIRELDLLGNKIGVSIKVQREEFFNTMHSI